MSEQASPRLNYELRRMEALWSPLKFQELAHTVEEVCLSGPLPEQQSTRSDSPEATLVAQLGTRGLRAAMDFLHGQEAQLDFGEGDDLDDIVNVDSPLRDPEFFSDEMDPTVVDWAERFGQALLGEAYQTLGEDVDDKIASYRAAETADGQLEVINWLNQRLHTMVYSDRQEAEDEDDLFYHPIRLSPKVIGRYPDINTPPTCLAVSVIAASFLKQTGSEMMHAGVAKTGLELEMEDTTTVLESIQSLDDALSDNHKQRLISSTTEMRQRIGQDRGYHAAVYTRLLDGSWCQLDPNFDASVCIDDEADNQRLTAAYSDLQDFRTTAPGLEIGCQLRDSTVANMYGNIWSGGHYRVGSGAPEAVASLLQSTSAETLTDDIQADIIDPYFSALDSSEGVSLYEMLELLGDAGSYQDIYQKTLDKWVLHGMTAQAVVERCQRDQAFLERRVQDIKALPSMLVSASMIKTTVEAASIEHRMLELGLPEARIGMAVLSDFAADNGSDLPASFWLTHWPSLVPISENMDDRQASGGQAAIVQNNLVWASGKKFTYSKINGIIDEFMSRQEG